MFLNAGNPYATVVIRQRKFQKPSFESIRQRYLNRCYTPL